MSAGTVFRCREVAEVVTKDGAALLVLDDRVDPRPLVLNDAAFLIWQRVPRGGISLDRVVAEVAQKVGLDPEQITDDVARFIDDLETRGLVVKRVGDGSQL